MYDLPHRFSLLSVVRLPGSGHKTIRVSQSDAVSHLCYSGINDNTGRHGVAIALSATTNVAVLDWDPISLRLEMTRLKGSEHLYRRCTCADFGRS